MLDQLKALAQTAQNELAQISSGSALEAWQSQYLGRRGQLTQLLRRVGELPQEARPAFGQQGNTIKQTLETAYQAKAVVIKTVELEQTLAQGGLDVTLPGRQAPRGRLHPSTLMLRHIYRILADMGFQLHRTREVETDEMNFQLLNFPPHHPAREMHDTYYTTTPGVLLRTHISPGQIHVMRQHHPEPIRAILPGMCYRNEQVNTRSEAEFYQLEGLVVGRNLRFSDLKGTLSDFARQLLGEGKPVRFRASHYPFTEPSADLDVYFGLDTEAHRRITKGTGWLEILGCGMVHPNVLRNGGYDPNRYTGFAFGIGPERIALRLYGIDDIRHFRRNNLQFLQQF